MAPPSAVFFMLRLAITSPQKGKQETGNRKSLFRTLVTQKFLLLTLKVFEEVYFHR